MKTLRLLGVIFVSCLLYGTSHAEHGFRPRQEYSFVLDGRTVAGFPEFGSQHHAGVHYRGLVKIQRDTTADTILLKFQNMTYINLHEDLPAGWWSETENTQVKGKELPITSSTISVKMGHSDVESVAVKKGLEKWEINFIQGVVNQLHAGAPIGTKLKGKQANISFKTKENSIYGRCEIAFEITKVPRSVIVAQPHLFPRAEICGSRSFYEIFKTRNFSNCENDPKFHFGLPKSRRCHPGGNECQDFWSRASVTRLSGCGDRSDFEILQSETNTRMIANLHLHNGSQASVSSYLNLNLKSVKPVSRHLMAPADPDVITDLKFQFTSLKDSSSEEALYDDSSDELEMEVLNMPIEKTTPKMKVKSKHVHPTTSIPPTTKPGKKKRSIYYPHMNMESPPDRPLNPLVQGVKRNEVNFNTIQKLRELITDASNELEVPKSISDRMTLEKVVYAIRLCRTMPYVDLSKTAAIISLQAKSNRMLQTERKLLRDVLVMCGTNPSFRILKAWLENRELVGEEASSVIAAMPSHMQTPEAQTVYEFHTLVRELTSRDNLQLKASAILALSNLLRIACVETDLREARFYTKAFRGRCKQEEVENYISWFVLGAKSPDPLRRVFITALGNTGNASALVHLKAIALDPGASAYIRTTAVYSMKYQVLNDPEEASDVLFSLYRNVGLPVPVRIAAVSLLFYAKPSLVSMQRIAVSTWYDPSLAVAAFVRSSFLSLSKVKDPAFQSISRYAASALPLTRPMASGLYKPHNFLWSRVASELEEVVLTQLSYDPSLEPSSLYFRYTQRHAGYSRVVMEGEMLASNLDHFLTELRELVYPSEDMAIYRPVIKDLVRSTRFIRENLEITERALPKFEGDFHFIWDKLNERMFPVDKQFFVDIAKGGRKIIHDMQNGLPFNYQKVNQKSMTIQVITELGFPVTFEMVVPWAFRLSSNSRISIPNKWLEVDVGVVYTSQQISELSFYTGWDGMVHMAGSHGVSLINLPPVKIVAMVRPQERSLELAISPIQQMFESVVLHHSTKVFTTQYSVLSLNPNTLKAFTSIISSGTSSLKEKEILPNINVSYTENVVNDSPLLWLKNAVSVMGFCRIWPSLETGTLQLELNNWDPMSLIISLDHAMKHKDVMEISTMPKTTENQINISSESEEMSNAKPSLSAERETSTEIETSDESERITSAPESTPINAEMEFDYFKDRLIPIIGPPVEALTISPNGTNTTTTHVYSTSPPTTVTSAPTTTTAKPSTTVTSFPDTEQHSGKFNASFTDPFTLDSGDAQVTYLLTEILNGFTSGKAYAMGFHLDGAGINQYNAYIAHSSETGEKEQRYAIFYQGKRLDVETSRLILTSTLQSHLKPKINLLDLINGNMSASLMSDIVLQNSGTQYKISAKTFMGRSEERLKSLEDETCVKTPENDISPHCLSKALDSMFFDTYNTTITYNDESKRLGSTLKKTFNYFRYWMLPYLSEDEEFTYQKGPANTLNGVLQISPQYDHINAKVHSQNMVVEFTGIPVNSRVTKFLLFHPAMGYTQRLKGDKYCGHGGDRWTTFDGLQYRYNLTSSWHVLSKDCSDRSRIAVLARRSTNKEIELEVNLDNYMILSLRPGLEILVNQDPVEFVKDVAELRDQGGITILQLERTQEGIVIVYFPSHHFHLLYSPNTLFIMADASTRSRLCGLCGDNNGDMANDLMNPRGNLETSVKRFGPSYALDESVPEDE